MLTFTRLFDCKPFWIDNKKTKDPEQDKQPVYPRHVSFDDTKLEKELGITEVAVTGPINLDNDASKCLYSNVILSGNQGTCMITEQAFPGFASKHFNHTIYAEDQPLINGKYLDQDKRCFKNPSKYEKITGHMISPFDRNVMLVRSWMRWVESFDLVEECLIKLLDSTNPDLYGAVYSDIMSVDYGTN